MTIKTSCIAVLVACLGVSSAFAQKTTPRFKVIAFYTGKADAAHISFVNEAKPWFARMAAEHHFSFESTQNWDNLNREFLAPYQVVVFLDTRPDSPRQREAFHEYMKNWRGLDGAHFSAFRAHALEIPAELGLVSQRVLGLRHVCREHMETHLGDPSSGGHPAPRDRRIAGQFPECPQRMVQVVQRSEDQPEYPDPGIDRSGQLPPWHRAEEARNLARWILSRRVDKPEIPHGLLQHGP